MIRLPAERWNVKGGECEKRLGIVRLYFGGHSNVKGWKTLIILNDSMTRLKDVGTMECCGRRFYLYNMKPIIEHSNYYHIFNRGNNHENIFIEDEDYMIFLDRMDIFINPIAEIYAWALLRNHFHILVRIKEEDEIGYFDSKYAKSDNPNLKWRTHFPIAANDRFTLKPRPDEQFKHFFNAYSRWFNRRHGRSGSLFQKNYERKQINNERYFTNLIVYIHNNPIRHGFTDHPMDYPWTSYLIIKSDKPTKLHRKQVIGYFGDLENYENMHTKPLFNNDELIDGLIIE